MDSKTQVHTTAAPVVARLTVIRSNGKRTIVEIHADATFHSFYHFFTQEGPRRSTKTPLRTACRNLYLPAVNAHLYQPKLDVIERQLRTVCAQSNPVVDSKIRIFKKRIYKTLINAAPDALGLTKVNRLTDPRFFTKPTPRIPVRIPENWLTIEKRMDIILGRG